MMSHTSPVNLAVFFGLQGRVYTTSSACTSGSQGIGSAFEAIQSGRADVMLAGGSEAPLATLCFGAFALMRAMSTRNDDPARAPRPLDPEFGVPKPAQVAWIDEARCIGCARCLPACPVDAIVGASRQMHTVITRQCTGCELCLPPCPVDCIELRPAPAVSRRYSQPRAA